ncbi:MAG: hypothetical protein WBP45_07825 [Daejeonella sp.]
MEKYLVTGINEPTHLVAHLYFLQPHRPKFLKELVKPTQKEKLNSKKFPTLLKNKKYATHSRHLMTRQLNNANDLQARWTETPAPKSGLAKVVVSFSADTFVDNQTLVLRINICAKNPTLFAKPQNVILSL